jgi:glutamate racemase
VDTVVLGCTHYPLLRGVVEAEARALLGAAVAVVDSAEAAAEDVREFLRERDLLRAAGAPGVDVRVTDIPGHFATTAARFLGEPVASVQQVDL